MSLISEEPDADGPLSFVKERSGRRIEEARKREGITQRELAKSLGIGVRWLREIESVNRHAKGTPDRRRRGPPLSDMMMAC